MTVLYFILFLLTGFCFLFSYRSGMKDALKIKENIPLSFIKKDDKEKEEFIKDYEKVMNYDFSMAGDTVDK